MLNQEIIDKNTMVPRSFIVIPRNKSYIPSKEIDEKLAALYSKLNDLK